MEEEKKFTIYLHRCPNGKCYVGMTSQNPKHRWGLNGNKYKNNKDFYADIEKYGWDNIEHTILEECLYLEDACESEKHNIKKYNCIYPNGYNLSIGGDIAMLGVKHSQETKNKISKSNKGNKSRTGQKLSKNEILIKQIKINQYSNYGSFVKTWESQKEAEEYIGCSRGSICDAIKKNKSLYGFLWKKYEGNTKDLEIKGINGCKLIVIDDVIYLKVKDVYNSLEINSKSLVSLYLTCSRKMPQKYIDRGLRYYNPETDSHLPIYVDTKEEV